MSNKPLCKYINVPGGCPYGNKCHFYHPSNNSVPAFQQKNKNTNFICKHFLAGAPCPFYPKCNFFHGYFEKLKFVRILQEHENPIHSLISMDNTKYLTSDSNEFFIRNSSDYNNYYKTTIESGYIIGKIIFSNNKVICGIEKKTT